MGGWRLEVARMAMYMSFPVILFHYFNQPQYFEDWVTSIRRELYPPENKEQKEMLQNAIRQLQEKHDKKMIEAFEESERNKNQL